MELPRSLSLPCWIEILSQLGSSHTMKRFIGRTRIIHNVRQQDTSTSIAIHWNKMLYHTVMGKLISFLLCSGPSDHEDEASPRLAIVRSPAFVLCTTTSFLTTYTTGRSHLLPPQGHPWWRYPASGHCWYSSSLCVLREYGRLVFCIMTGKKVLMPGYSHTSVANDGQ